MRQEMDFRVLGPLEVFGERGKLDLGGPKPRVVLGVLLLHPNEPVSAERLAIALEGDNAPPTAPRRVQVHISRLRKALGDVEILTREPAGYRLRVRAGELDAERFKKLFDDGRRALDSGQTEHAASILREALALWRGPPLAELAFDPFEQTEIARLEEQRLAAVEACVEADLAVGRHAAMVGELQQLVAANPTRERLAGQLMLALYRSGRQAEALETYREARGRLIDVGVEPGPELRRLQMAILRQDVALEPPAAVAELPREVDASTAPPLIGRGAELAWLREHLERARDGAGLLVTVAGARGIGKSRLAAELGGEAHRAGTSVLYVAGAGPREATLEAIGRAHGVAHPTLLIVDDADQASADVLATFNELTPVLPNIPLLVLASGEDAEALARLGGNGSLELEPLDAESVRAIAALYAPGHPDDEIPAEWLLDTSGGIPRRLHEVARQWARREAARRVGSVAGRAAAGRVELRSMEAELAGGVVELQAAGERFGPLGEEEAPVVCPFKGLAPFDVADAEYFFGRERLVAELVARLVGTPLLGVVGPSGSGKSSVVRAGLLPALASGVLPGSEEWTQVLVRPGEHPLDELSGAAAGVEADRKVVLAIDQFEETFTACRDEEERTAFISKLARAPRRDAGMVVVVVLRADFYGRCATYPEVSRMLAANHVLVGPMRHVELRRAVVGPAQRGGLDVEPDLVETLVNDVEDEPGALPLLSTALLELWQRRDGRRLRLASYEETGGVHGAVARLAEEAFGRLDEGQQALARTVLLRLAEVEPEGGVERRRLPLEELDDGGGDVASVVGLLANARLLTVSAGSVEFAHEALLREWPRLRQWIEDDREDLRIHRNVSAAAHEWARLGRDEEALYRGARLAEAREWAERGDPGPTEPEREFLAASLERARRARRAGRRRLAVAFGTLALALVAIAAVALVAVNQRRDAERQRNIAISQQLALQSEKERDADPELATRLALWALDTSPTDQSAIALREATLAFNPFKVLPADSIDANAAAYSRDGTHVVTGGADGRAVVWDMRTGRPSDELKTGGREILAARYSPAGDRVALGLDDGTVLVADGSLAEPDDVLRVKGSRVEDLAFSGDGRRIAAALDDGTVRVLAADGGEPVQLLEGHTSQVLGVDISGDGSRVVSASIDGTTRLWDLRGGGTGKILHSGGANATDAAFSPDASRILGVGEDGRIRLWNARTGAEVSNWSGEGRGLLAAAFSADGQRIVAGGRDGITRVWSVNGGRPLAVLAGQKGDVYDVGFGPSTDRVVSAGDDGTVRLWDAGEIQAWAIPSVTYDLDFNRNGHLIASSSQDGTLRIWDPATARRETRLPGPEGYTVGKFASNANRLVIASYEGSVVRVWPMSAKTAEVVVDPDRGVFSAEFDETAERIVYVDATGRIAVRNLASGVEVELRGGPKTVYAAEFTPDGERVVAIPDKGDVLVWRIDSPDRPEHTLKGHRGKVVELDISRDGRIATSGADRTVRVWDPGGGPAVVMRGNEDQVTTAVFTPDGSQVISAGADGTLRLWDARTGAALAVLESGRGELYDVAVSPDGKIATLGKGEIVRIFDCAVCGSLEHVRDLALSRSPRQLTAEERQHFLAAAE